MLKTRSKIDRIRDYLDEKDYVEKHESIPPTRKFAHFWLLVIKSFLKNRGPVRAASLAYTTLLALVPVLAVVVSVSSAFIKKEGQEPINRLVERFVGTIAPQLDLIPRETMPSSTNGTVPLVAVSTNNIPGETKVNVNRGVVAEKILGYINRIDSSTLGVTAGIMLVFVAVMLLSTIETAFNDMWGVTRGRTWFSRIVQYWTTISLGPIFVVTATALTTGAEVERAQIWLGENTFPGFFLFRLIPFLVITLFLTLFYRLMPATKVRLDAAFVGGLVGGCLLQLNSMSSVLYISRVTTYSKIYGGLGVVPIFLLGLYFSWLILLFGAQVAYAFQNRQTYIQEKQAESIHQRGREFIALRLMTFIGSAFHKGDALPTRLRMATELGVPMQLAASILGHLVNNRLLIEIVGEETGYAPARPIDRISVEDILNSLRIGRGQDLATLDEPTRQIVREEFDRIMQAESEIASHVSLHEMVIRAEQLKSQMTEGLDISTGSGDSKKKLSQPALVSANAVGLEGLLD
ncbi:MAG: YhjD/YihY/BrkB family envelope integrity protein [Verrucomicrobiales bacterium]